MLLDVQYLVANSHLLHVGPQNDAVESQDQEFEVPDIKVRPTGTAHDNALVLVARYTCRTNLSKHKPIAQSVLNCYKYVHNYKSNKLLVLMETVASCVCQVISLNRS